MLTCEAVVQDGTILLKVRQRTGQTKKQYGDFVFEVRMEGPEGRRLGFGRLFPL